MNLAQMRSLLFIAEETITNYAGGNDAFDRERVNRRQDGVVQTLGDLDVMPWTAFAFTVFNETHTVVLDKAGRLIGRECQRKR